MTPAKPGMHQELVEPLREFLESFTQELTEQQFIPAFREEVRLLLAATDRIQESGDTLQQIAAGVERMREVFAPSGTRMLEGVKELEALMKANADDLKVQAETVLGDLLKTHGELEEALRKEAGVLNEQTSVGRETLNRTATEIEERLGALTEKIDGLCRKTETEVSQLSGLGEKIAEGAVAPAPTPTAATAPAETAARVEITEDLQELFSRTESVVAEELSRYQAEVRETLKSSTKENSERLARVDKTIEEALKSVGPRVQEELDSALERLRDQIQTLASVEAEVRRGQEEGESKADAVSDASFKAALSSSENRLLKELAEVRKAGNGRLSATEKAITDLAMDLSDVTEKHTERLFNESVAIKDSLARMDRAIRDSISSDDKIQKQIQDSLSRIDGIASAQQSQSENSYQQSDETRALIHEQSAAHQKSAAENREQLERLHQALSRAEETVAQNSQALIDDSRMQREQIETDLEQLHEKISSRLDDTEARYLEALGKLADDWTETLRALHGEIDTKIQTAADQITRHNRELGGELQERAQRAETIQRDLADEVKRSESAMGERFEALQETTEKFTGAMESHVKAVSGEVGRLRSKQEQQLEVLKEAIRANYDDNAERLRETIEAAYDKFLNQVRTIPQALERYSKFIESLHQNDRLALEQIQSEMGNVLRMQTEKFELLESTTGGMKKVFPLMDKKLEKQGQILEAMRRSQIAADKDLDGLKKGLAESRQETLNFAGDVKGEMKAVENRTNQRFQEHADMLANTFEQLERLQQTDLPSFRQELKNLLVSKFEFIESTQNDQHTAWRSDLMKKLESERKTSRSTSLLLGLLILLAIATQVSLNWSTILEMLP